MERSPESAIVVKILMVEYLVCSSKGTFVDIFEEKIFGMNRKSKCEQQRKQKMKNHRVRYSV